MTNLVYFSLTHIVVIVLPLCIGDIQNVYNFPIIIPYDTV